MQTSQPVYLDYLQSTTGMLKSQRIQFLKDSINTCEHDFYIYFGSYWQFQKNDAGYFIKEPLLWRVLNKQTFDKDGCLLLLTKYLIEQEYFSYNGNEYKDSHIREELNGSFYQNAFSKKEQKHIIPTVIDDYADNVCLLAYEDYTNPTYFKDTESRKASCTEYTSPYRKGYLNKKTKTGTYWTRSKGSLTGVLRVDSDGYFSSWRPYHKCPGWHHSFAPMPYETVRPSIKIKI